MDRFDQIGEDPATPELLRFAVATLKTPAKLGTGIVSGAAGMGQLLTDPQAREQLADSIVDLYENPRQIAAAAGVFADQPAHVIASDLFAFSGEMLVSGGLASKAGKLSKGAGDLPDPKHATGWKTDKVDGGFHEQAAGNRLDGGGERPGVLGERDLAGGEVVSASGSSVADEVAALGRIKANAENNLTLNQHINLKGGVADEYASLTDGLSNRQIRNEIGPVLAGVLDTKSGKYFYRTNSGPGELPDNLAPLLGARIEVAQSIDYVKTHGAGTHAEVHALNDALTARPEADISDFLLYTINSGQKGATAKWGMPVPRCPHCEFITDGIQYFPETLTYGK